MFTLIQLVIIGGAIVLFATALTFILNRTPDEQLKSVGKKESRYEYYAILEDGTIIYPTVVKHTDIYT